ncbi:MAG: phosphate ABC transporter permease PtsA, partial [Zoogloea sp.]|nr:phosphate ABC transporter permease PtsA [Zoogloea sp.]
MSQADNNAASLYRSRVRTNRIALTLSLTAMAIGMGFLGWIMFVLLVNGLGAISLDMFIKSTPSPSSEGGLANAILGSLMM